MYFCQAATLVLYIFFKILSLHLPQFAKISIKLNSGSFINSRDGRV